MIDPSKLTNEDKGRWVIYRSRGGDKLERGRLKSWNDTFLFVVYGNMAGDPGWQNYTGSATNPEDLEFENGA